jgi:hypothetical protein
MVFIKGLKVSLVLAGLLLSPPAALAASPAAVPSSAKLVFPASFSGTIDGCFTFNDFPYCVNETFKGALEKTTPCVKVGKKPWACFYDLSSADGTIKGTETDSDGHSTACSAHAHGLKFGKDGAFGENYALIILTGDGRASVIYQSTLSGSDKAPCNAGWLGTNGGDYPPPETLRWKLGEAARWHLDAVVGVMPEPRIDSPLHITWHGRHTIRA